MSLVRKSPSKRMLRVFAFDPSLSYRFETLELSEVELAINWEELTPGPVGEYLEVVDVDPGSGVAYHPVDLNHPFIVAEDGLSPSESDPQFHQQMVYAVAMVTIRQFERALGRVAFWSAHRWSDESGYADQFVRRLRIYPHALREQNAYYSPQKKALLFGYFPVTRRDENNTPGTMVFTCLSHHIIAHEVTHALLDGVHPRFNEPTNPDVHAFHEAFADLVALFQQFSYPTVLKNQLRVTWGSLESENLLSQLAQQFGYASGRNSALRDALGELDPETGEWSRKVPDPELINKTWGAHSRGGILVSAVFLAFLKVYRRRTDDLFRIASGNTGVLPQRELHPDLIERLAREAAECAQRFLQMCVRAIDYCPPVDITFGDFLRGIVTADRDFNPEDDDGARVAILQSFREWGIHPTGLQSVGLDSLLWNTGEEVIAQAGLSSKEYSQAQESLRRRLISKRNKNDGKSGYLNWDLESDRAQVWSNLADVAPAFWGWLYDFPRIAEALNLVLKPPVPPTVYSKDEKKPSVEVHSVRVAQRRTLEGMFQNDIVVEVTQRRRGYFSREQQQQQDKSGAEISYREKGDFEFRAGCTFFLDVKTLKLRWVIPTAGRVDDDFELERVRRFLSGDYAAGGNAFSCRMTTSLQDGYESREPFALLHREDS